MPQFFKREWHAKLAVLLAKGLTVAEVAHELKRSEGGIYAAMARAERAGKPLARSVRSTKRPPQE